LARNNNGDTSCSPRMRGWSPAIPDRPGHARLLPAHAGLVPTASRPTRGRRPAPRACGVGPRGPMTAMKLQNCSPRMRGWSLPPCRHEITERLLPAHAGLVPWRLECRTGTRPAPRACGVGPVGTAPEEHHLGCSPRMRGWSLVRACARVDGPLLPAHAGLVPAGRRLRSAAPSAPRACGVGPAFSARASREQDCSPRMRGWSHDRRRHRAHRDLLPAHAGLVPRLDSERVPERPAPRAWGVGPAGVGGAAGDVICSPRMRGWSRRNKSEKDWRSLLPAHAGLVPSAVSGVQPRAAAPRACGVGPCRLMLSCSASCCSPRMRGWSRAVRNAHHRADLLPAHAGLVPAGASTPVRRRAAPHACGVGPWSMSPPLRVSNCSPPMRGWSLPLKSREFERSLLPDACGVSPAWISATFRAGTTPCAYGIGLAWRWPSKAGSGCPRVHRLASRPARRLLYRICDRRGRVWR